MVDASVATLFLQLSVVLLVARTLGRLAKAAGMAPVVGELLTGLVLGPALFGRLAPGAFAVVFPTGADALGGLAAIGLVLLLVVAGIETNLDTVRRRVGTTVAVTLGGVTVPFGLGFLLIWVVPAPYLGGADRLLVALFVGASLSISAVPVISRILADLDATEREVGQLILASAVITDLVGWLLLAVVAGIVRTGSIETTSLVRVVGALGVFLAGAYLIGRPVIDFLLLKARHVGTPTLSTFSVVVMSTVVGVTIGLMVGIEAAVGAFVVGLLLGRSTHLDRPTIDTLELVTLGLFAPLFFGSAGLEADLAGVLEPGAGAVVSGLLAVAIAGKFGGAFLAAVAVGVPRWEAVSLGAGLNARGALEIVAAAMGRSLGLLSPVLYTGIVLVAVVTSMLASPLLRWALKQVPADASAAERLEPS